MEPRYEDKYMSVAFTKAHEALSVGEVPIGCVFVTSSGDVLAETRNTVNQTKNATRHAEINAVDVVEEVARREGRDSSEIYKDLTVYVNVEPCIMCAAALLKMRVLAIYYGCPNDKFGGCGSVGDMMASEARLYPDYRVTVSGGHRSEEAIALLKEFYNGENPNAPNPKVKGQKVKKTLGTAANKT